MPAEYDHGHDDAAASPDAYECAWFALCDRPAVKFIHHPILGDVPTCQRCIDKLDLEESSTDDVATED